MNNSSNIINQYPYLKTSVKFPEDINHLVDELNISYVDIANNINDRTIGLYPTDRPAIGGEAWFISDNRKQQNLRQVYTFTTAGNIKHGIDVTKIGRFTKCCGAFTDGTNTYGVIFGSSTAITGQVSFYITSSNIVVLADGAAPAITSGFILLEWIGNT